jgi:CubicO group peptidase (beta-lactamase class C family)
VQRIIDDEKSAPGIQHLIVDAGEHTFSTVCHGVLDTAGQEHDLVTPQTIFMAYSTTKIITAIAILQLIERGQMKLDAPLTTYLQNQHPWRTAITARYGCS